MSRCICGSDCANPVESDGFNAVESDGLRDGSICPSTLYPLGITAVAVRPLYRVSPFGGFPLGYSKCRSLRHIAPDMFKNLSFFDRLWRARQGSIPAPSGLCPSRLIPPRAQKSRLTIHSGRRNRTSVSRLMRPMTFHLSIPLKRRARKDSIPSPFGLCPLRLLFRHALICYFDPLGRMRIKQRAKLRGRTFK